MAGFQFDFLPCFKSNLCHKKSGDKFTLVRKKSLSSNFLKYTLYTGTNQEIGSICVDYEANPYYAENPSHQTVSKNWYSIYDIVIRTKYQRLSFGTALVYLIVKEVQINSGCFLYVALPAPTVLPFYLSCGFFPEPETVTDIMKNQPSSLEAHAHLRRRYLMWRGAIAILNANLHPKFASRFEIDF